MRPTSLCLCMLLLLGACRSHNTLSPVFAEISPQQAGYDAKKLDLLRHHLEATGAESMLLLHQGKVFFSFGDVNQPRLVHSIRKSLLNSLIGIGVADGCIRLDATLAELAINEKVDALTNNEQQATVRDLLQSRSGVYHQAAAENEAMTQHRPARGSHAPNTHYYYNNWDFNAIGAIYEQQCGQSVFEAFEQKIARPLGMSFRANPQRVILETPDAPLPAGSSFYQLEPSRSQYPAYHFRLSATDLALYGQLYLQRGYWQGTQLLPEQWIDDSTQPYSVTQPEYGLAYGMLWAVVLSAPDNISKDKSAKHAFYHTGNGVHMLGIYPQQQMVFVLRVNTETDYSFHEGHLYQAIRLAHGARLSADKE